MQHSPGVGPSQALKVGSETETEHSQRDRELSGRDAWSQSDRETEWQRYLKVGSEPLNSREAAIGMLMLKSLPRALPRGSSANCVL